MVKTVLKGAGLVLLVLLALAGWLAATPLPRPQVRFETPAWVGPVRIVDIDAGAVVPGQALALRGGRIVAVVPVARLTANARRSMAGVGNAFVMPALWDMHGLLTRHSPSLDHPLYLAHGVTRVRNILDCPGGDSVNLHPCRAAKVEWNARIAAGEMIGPAVMGSGTYPVAGAARAHRDAPPEFAGASPDDARRLVRLFAAERRPTDHIKTYDGIPRDSFFALMEEAGARRVEVSGHVPAAVGIGEAAAAGFRAIAHARSLPIGCSSREAEIMRLRSGGARSAQWMEIAVESYDPGRCAALWSLLRRHGTYVSPTLITRYSETREGMSDLSGDAATDAATPGLVKYLWQEDVTQIETRTAAEEAIYRRYYRAAADRTAEAARAGVSLLLGSDTNDVYVAPGIGLHKEIELWRRAGIPSRTILLAGTANAARYFGLGDRVGRIAPGHVADIIFLDRDPLRDLTALRRPRAVMMEGRLYRRPELDAAIASAEKVAAGWRYPVHFIRDLLRNPLGFAN